MHTVIIELSDDEGATWREIGRSDASARRYTWIADGEAGVSAVVRIRTPDGRARSRSRRILLASPVKQISSGGAFCVALHEDGRLRFWGQIGGGFYYEPLDALSVGSVSTLIPRPTVLPGFDDVVSVAAGGAHLIAIKKDGSAWIWGEPYDSSLNVPIRVTSPTRIEGIEKAVWARASAGRSFIAVQDGRVYGIGGHGNGLFGAQPGVPTDVASEWPELNGVVDIQFGEVHALALRDDGTMLSFGSNETGQLGDPDAPSRSLPAPVPSVTDVQSIFAHFKGSMALRRDGTVLVWGAAQFDGNLYRTPTLVPHLDHVVSIAFDGVDCFAMKDDGILYVWGMNWAGGFGDGTTTGGLEPRPCPVKGIRQYEVRGAIQVVTMTGERFAWGANDYLIGDGTIPNRLTPVPVYSP